MLDHRAKGFDPSFSSLSSSASSSSPPSPSTVVLAVGIAIALGLALGLGVAVGVGVGGLDRFIWAARVGNEDIEARGELERGEPEVEGELDILFNHLCMYGCIQTII